jgi:hypothetical protein
MRPSRKVLILLVVLLGVAAVAIGVYVGRSGGTHMPPSASQASPGSTTAPVPEPSRGTGTVPPASRAPVQPAWSTGPRVTAETDPAAYLVAIRPGRHSGYDRVVFEFRGRVPGYDIRYVDQVGEDPSDRPVPLRGRAFLHVVFRHASTIEQLSSGSPPYRTTYVGPSVITPGLGTLLQVKQAGDFEAYLSLGVGLADRTGFRVVTLTGPPRVAIDVAHVQLGAFPGIWDIRTWEQAWEIQEAVDNGHQPWRASPTDVVVPYAISVLGVAQPIVRLVDADTVEVSKPGSGVVATVHVAQPVTHRPGGIWVITKVDRHS